MKKLLVFTLFFLVSLTAALEASYAYNVKKKSHTKNSKQSSQPFVEQAQITFKSEVKIISEITAEVADEHSEMEKGLMGRATLKPDTGMLFDYASEKEVGMWMKDTLIPLDMIFINAEGKIIKIQENTQPLSLAIIRSEQPIRYVIEVKGGYAKEKGIKVGDFIKVSRK